MRAGQDSDAAKPEYSNFREQLIETKVAQADQKLPRVSGSGTPP